LTADNFMERRMSTEFFAFDDVHRLADTATHPQVRLGVRLPLSLVVAGPGLPPPRFAADTRPDAPSGASNYGF
jgi:hypothetical protein